MGVHRYVPRLRPRPVRHPGNWLGGFAALASLIALMVIGWKSETHSEFNLKEAMTEPVVVFTQGAQDAATRGIYVQRSH